MIQASPTGIQNQRISLLVPKWAQFKQLQGAIAQDSKARLYYYQGKVEIFMPGKDHEAFKSLIGQLIELFFLKRGIVYRATGYDSRARWLGILTG